MRPQTLLFVQQRTRHIQLRKYLQRIGKAESPKCLACQANDETVHHFLLISPVYAAQMRRMEKHMWRAARLISMLL